MNTDILNSPITSFKLLCKIAKNSEKKKPIGVLIFLSLMFATLLSFVFMDLFATISHHEEHIIHKYRFLIKLLFLLTLSLIYAFIIKPSVAKVIKNYLEDLEKNKDNYNFKNCETDYIFYSLVNNKSINGYLRSGWIINWVYLLGYILLGVFIAYKINLAVFIIIYMYCITMLIKFAIIDFAFSKLIYRNVFKNKEKKFNTDVANSVNYITANLATIMFLLLFLPWANLTSIGPKILAYPGIFINSEISTGIILFTIIPLFYLVKVIALLVLYAKEKNNYKYLAIFLPAFYSVRI